MLACLCSKNVWNAIGTRRLYNKIYCKRLNAMFNIRIIGIAFYDKHLIYRYRFIPSDSRA